MWFGVFFPFSPIYQIYPKVTWFLQLQTALSLPLSPSSHPLPYGSDSPYHRFRAAQGTAKRCVLPSLSELTSRREENATASETTTAAPKAVKGPSQVVKSFAFQISSFASFLSFCEFSPHVLERNRLRSDRSSWVKSKESAKRTTYYSSPACR